MPRSQLLCGLVALAGCSPVALASIVYRDIPDIHLVSGSPDDDVSAFLDIDGDGVDDIRLRAFFSLGDSIAATSASSLRTLPGLAFLDAPGRRGPEPLSFGDLIGPDLPPPHSFSRSWGTAGALDSRSEGIEDGWWPPAVNAFMGVRVPVPGGALYGWVLMNVDLYHINVFSLAYETEVNAPIAAGAVPCPGSFLAVLAGAGALLRRRR